MSPVLGVELGGGTAQRPQAQTGAYVRGEVQSYCFQDAIVEELTPMVTREFGSEGKMPKNRKMYLQCRGAL